MKKNILLIFAMALSIYSTFAQTVTAERISNLVPEGYSVTGQATLQQFDNGDVKLNLSEDFDTPAGPDVRVLLGNALSLTNTVEIANLSDLNHFEGAITFDVPDTVNINDYQFILFFCVSFQQFWASGEFAPAVVIGNGCQNSTTSSTGTGSIDLCSSDGEADIVTFSNSIGTAAGDNYAYLITDDNEVLQEVVLNNTFDFEGSSDQMQRVYGISYDGELSPAIGSNRSETTAANCFVHSQQDTFLTITKNACSSGYECQETLTATTDWVVEVQVCPDDGMDDEIALRNNLFIPTGSNYAFLITDANEILQEVVFDTLYNFEGSGMEEQRVYGLNYSGQLNPAIGEPRLNTTASECFIHSGANLFLTIKKATVCLTYVHNISLSEQVAIFPNPSSDLLHIIVPEDFLPVRVSILNLLGAKILSQAIIESTNIQVDIPNLNPGNYILRIENEDQVVNRKIQVVR